VAVYVDLVTRTLTAPDGRVTPFAVDRLRREALLHGLDDIGLTLRTMPSSGNGRPRTGSAARGLA
jgi:3-isopropylmalate dehydratase small subunit